MTQDLTPEQIAELDDALGTIEYYLNGDIEDLRVLGDYDTVESMQQVIETLRNASDNSWTGIDWSHVVEAFRAGAHYCEEDFATVEKAIRNDETGDEACALRNAENSVMSGLAIVTKIHEE